MKNKTLTTNQKKTTNWNVIKKKYLSSLERKTNAQNQIKIRQIIKDKQ